VGVINFFKNIINLLKGIIFVIEEAKRKLGLRRGLFQKSCERGKENEA